QVVRAAASATQLGAARAVGGGGGGSCGTARRGETFSGGHRSSPSASWGSHRARLGEQVIDTGDEGVPALEGVGAARPHVLHGVAEVRAEVAARAGEPGRRV